MNLGPKIDLDNNDKKRKIWFMSDLHYNHENILWINKKTRGHFQDITQMNQYYPGHLCSMLWTMKGDNQFENRDKIDGWQILGPVKRERKKKVEKL